MFFALPLCGSLAAKAEKGEGDLCGIHFENSPELDFSKTEEEWLCGREDSAAWKTIPFNQKKFFLQRFLQNRGFHQPSFREEGDTLVASSGPRLVAKEFKVTGAPPELNWKRRRRLLDQPLTPSLLDEAGNWTERELQQSGYPCPHVNSNVLTDTGAIEVKAESGPMHSFGRIESEGDTADIPFQIIDRYTAFLPGQRFDVRLLELSSRRILNQDLYLSTYYDISCPESGQLRIVRRFVPAPPRLITAGVGIDTERGPLARARYRRVRIGPSANIWETTLLATIHEQKLESRFHWFYSDDLASPLRLMPTIAFEREDEERYETSTYRFSPLFANEWEKEKFQLGAELGPSFERTITHRGLADRLVDTGRLIAHVRATSHLFEYYASHPQEGWNLTLDSSTRVKNYFSKETFERLAFTHELLWNLGEMDPPFLVLGLRGYAGTYITPERSGTLLAIPLNERFFLGGDADIRGFGRKSVPANERGFLTSIYEGIELRAGEWWSTPVEPLIFLDLAKGGERPGQLDRPLYYAPGLGLRYQSPIGSIRTTLGRGFVANRRAGDPEGGFQFFLSLGKEF
jgi:translocation and assembly module TamA